MPAPAEDIGEGQSIVERDEIEGIIDGFAAMDLSEHSLRREGTRITQEGTVAEGVPMVNPDPMGNADQRVNPDLSTEVPFTRLSA